MGKKSLVYFFSVLFLFFIFSTANAGGTGCPVSGLVPCGTQNCPCSLCDLFVLIDNVIDFLLFKFVIVLAILMVAIGGFMMLFAYGNPSGGGSEMINKAKALFKSVAFGLLIVYGAWLIVNLFLWAIGVTAWSSGGNWWTIPCDPV